MSHSGTNDYNAQKLTPSETVVSRTLQSKNRFWSNLVWRTGKPALDSEWNLINDMNLEMVSGLIRSMTPSGWLSLGRNKYPIGNSGIPNNFQFYSTEEGQHIDIPNVIINGWPLIIGGIDHNGLGLAVNTDLNSIVLEPATNATTGYRDDFVFLEVWRAQVRSRDTNNNPIAQNKPSNTEIYAYGNTQYGGTHFVDDIVDPAIKPSTDGIETSQRVQIQYRVRVVSNVVFDNSLSTGFEDVNVQGQGANPNPQIAGFPFMNMGAELNDTGLWRSGNGDEASRTALRTVDGYTYAIPMFKVYRRSQIPYSDTGVDASDASNNQQGNNADLSGVSDRPDGKFHDGIDATDILDLRFKVSLEGLDFDSLLEKNLHTLFSGHLESARRELIQYDSIADTDIYGYNDFRNNEGASGKRIVWSDSAIDQDDNVGRVSVTTTDISLHVYVIKNSGSAFWDGSGVDKDQIIVQTTSKLPVGSIIKATPKIYVEEKDPFATDISITSGTWTGLNSSMATFTFNTLLSHNKNLWVYFDISIPYGQGINYVSNGFELIKYVNYSSHTDGSVVRGEILHSREMRFQDLGNHPFENKVDSTVYKEVEFVRERKQIELKPLIQTTTARDGGTRSLEIETLDSSAKLIIVPFKIQHLKGIYTSATGGIEVATSQIFNTQVNSVDTTEDSILISENFYIAELQSVLFDPTGYFVGGETELLVANSGAYNPVYEHRKVGSEPLGTRVRFYDANGDIFDIPDTMTASNFRWTGRKIAVRNGSGDGYDIDDFVIDCTNSDNNATLGSLPDGQKLYVDMDYLSPLHKGAEVRIIYKHSPYQGMDVGSQPLQLIHKRQTGVFMNNGTGGGLVGGSSGTSNFHYTPLSPKLPGVLSDFLRDGAVIDLASKGLPRFNSDMFFHAAYEYYGYYDGGTMWARDDYQMPPAPQSGARGFYGLPMLEVIFELPSIDQPNAEFIMPLLVKHKVTKELFLLVQIGNKGVQKVQSGPIYLELFRLEEKMLLK